MKEIHLNELVVVITGASSGVGRAIALEFARYGAKLVLSARRGEALSQLVKEVEELGGTAAPAIADVTDAKALEEVASAAVLFGGKIDVWVNNAGVLAAGEFTQTPVEVHDRVVEINLLGYIHGAYAVLPYFKSQGHGTLINNISVGGWFATPYAVGYSASKFGLRGFTESLRAELHKFRNIHVCDIYPAFLDTPGIQHAANYTKVALKPAPPVYDPQLVARSVVSLVQSPRALMTIGSASTFLRLLHFFAPTLSLAITAKVMERYFTVAEPAQETSGNLFHPVDYGTSIHGGWSAKTNNIARLALGGLLVSSFLTGFFVMSKTLRKPNGVPLMRYKIH
jgi:short-subunit dehydrogenase